MIRRPFPVQLNNIIKLRKEIISNPETEFGLSSELAASVEEIIRSKPEVVPNKFLYKHRQEMFLVEFVPPTLKIEQLPIITL